MRKVLLFLISLSFACTNEENNNFQNVDLFEEEAKLYWENINILEDEVHDNGFRETLTQETVDYYAGLVGYEPGEISLDLVIDIKLATESIENNGIEAFLEEHEDNEFARSVYTTFHNGEWIEDLEEHPMFSSLPLEKKEILLLANAIMKDYITNGEDHQSFNRTHNWWPGFVGGTVIGGALGGWPGAFGGAIIGSMFGLVAGHK